MKQKRLIFLVAGIVLFFCLSLDSYAQQQVIRWGVSASLQREAGIGSKNATEIAAQEINAAGGILGHKIEVFYADDEASPEKGITAVKKLIFQDKSDFITGGWPSGGGLAPAGHTFNAKKLWFSVGPATPKLDSMVKENYAKAKYFFRVGCVNSDWFAHDIALFAEEFFMKELGLTKVALLPESSVWASEM